MIGGLRHPDERDGMAPVKHNLTPETAAEHARSSTARGDGRTLAEHLADYHAGRSGVRIRQDGDVLRVGYRTASERWLLRVGVGTLLAAGAAGTWLGWPGAWGLHPLRWAVTGVLLLAAAALFLGVRRAVRVRLDPGGVTVREGKLGLGTTHVDLSQLRRFKVDKPDRAERQRRDPPYSVLALTRAGEQVPVARNVPGKADAYLITLLMIEWVKRLRHPG